ncbi:MAG TPA: division plane positioning ATPase MipZ [Patescibacteria group bacterium]|nr:division plane positioning ATPase MipZ [Patescibacteria group bacterium]
MREPGRSAHIIVVGNEKGGSGKTTVAMHVAVALLRLGFGVGGIDLDPRQQSLTRYVENRRQWCETNGVTLPMPDHRLIGRSQADSVAVATLEDADALTAAVAELEADCDFIIIDCPGSDVPLSRFAHGLADTLVTPLNDSFVDLDLLLQFRASSLDVEGLGVYLQMLWDLRQERRARQQPGFDWIIVRNRLSALDDRNKRDLMQVLQKLAPLIGFRLAGGIGERIIFRQLFLQGLTVLDIGTPGVDIAATKSHDAAREEVRSLLRALWLPKIDRKLDRL